MKELEERIMETCKLIEQYALLQMRDKGKLAGKLLPDITKALSDVVPNIVETYQDPKMKDHEAEVEYWYEQLGRITEAIQGQDAFAKIDVLYMETRENLIYVIDLLKGKGIL